MSLVDLFVLSLHIRSTNAWPEGGVQHIILGMSRNLSISCLYIINTGTLAMSHRGRLNLLTGLLEYPPTALFHKIKGGSEFPEEYGVEGDVISHLCMYISSLKTSVSLLNVASSPSMNYAGATGPIKISFLPNPSHLGSSVINYVFFSLRDDDI